MQDSIPAWADCCVDGLKEGLETTLQQSPPCPARSLSPSSYKSAGVTPVTRISWRHNRLRPSPAALTARRPGLCCTVPRKYSVGSHLPLAVIIRDAGSRSCALWYCRTPHSRDGTVHHRLQLRPAVGGSLHIKGCQHRPLRRCAILGSLTMTINAGIMLGARVGACKAKYNTKRRLRPGPAALRRSTAT